MRAHIGISYFILSKHYQIQLQAQIENWSNVNFIILEETHYHTTWFEGN